MRVLATCILLLAAAAGPTRAQAPGDALAALWTTLCAGAAPGSDLAARCAEIFAGGPGSRDASADGNFLGEIPGQGRAATRDGAPEDAAARAELALGLSLFASADVGRLKRRDGRNLAVFGGNGMLSDVLRRLGLTNAYRGRVNALSGGDYGCITHSRTSTYPSIGIWPSITYSTQPLVRVQEYPSL